MIIELFGLPGTGKTTIAKALHQEGGFQLVRTGGLAEIIWFNLLFCLKHPLAAFSIFAQVYNNPRRIFNFFLYRNAKYEKSHRYPKAVIDEGLFQNLLSILDQPLAREKFWRLARRLPPVDLLVILEVADQERQQRVTERHTYTRADRDLFYEEFLKILPELKLNYIKVGAQNSAAAAQQIKDYVENH